MKRGGFKEDEGIPMNERSSTRMTASEVRADGDRLWHALELAEVLTELGTSGEGLDSAEAHAASC